MNPVTREGEGRVSVPGGELHYRLSGPQGAAGPVLVFENGWSGSFPYAWQLEQALAPRWRVLFYDRAGIAESRSTEPLSPALLTRQLEALLSSLGIDSPVVVLGHSYGGLIGALHAAQSPGLVRAIVQIDPTPEFNDETIDKSLRAVPVLARLLQFLALLGLDGPVFSEIARELPPEIVARLRRRPLEAVKSLSGSIAEIRLLEQIRGVIAASADSRRCPRLVISAAPPPKPVGSLRKALGHERQAQVFQAAAHGLHQRHAAQNAASHWMTLPYSHVSLVTHPDSAKAVAAALGQFLK